MNKIMYLDKKIRIPDKVSELMMQASKKYAKDVQGSSEYYADERNAKTPNINNILGKYAEFAASLWLSSVGLPKLLPDVKIYGKEKKSYAADLPYSKFPEVMDIETQKWSRYPDVHVKCCDEYVSGGILKMYDHPYSWTFGLKNFSNNRGRDPLLDQPDSSDWVAFVYVHTLQNPYSKMIAFAPWKLIYPLLKAPISDKFKGHKLCVYADDLILSNYRIKEYCNA